MSSTFSPQSRKYSATLIAVFGASRRIIGLSSPVETMAMARLRSATSDSSRNSRTSRPRSPTSAMTAVSKPRDARQHGQQRRFADAGAGENADALSGAKRRKQIDHAHAGLDRQC